MSTTRRQLGTGPSATTSMPSVVRPPRLLPSERTDLAALPEPLVQNEPEATPPSRRPLRARRLA
ncbi:hypothetical protein ACFXKI_32520 [Streptomyces mirabilis]|uniref:hypothetical protein n=1 Tax=Streptomyces mirabilis TaxID=68239 RepID=UPI0036C42C42